MPYSIAENVQRGGGEGKERKRGGGICTPEGGIDTKGKTKQDQKSIFYTGPTDDENSIHSDRNLGSVYPIDAEQNLLSSLNCNSSEKPL